MKDKNGIDLPMDNNVSEISAEPENKSSADASEAPFEENDSMVSTPESPEENNALDNNIQAGVLNREQVGEDSSGSDEGEQAPDLTDAPAHPTVKHAEFQQLSSAGRGGESNNIDLLMDVDLPVSIELGRTRMKIADLLALGPGSIVELDKLVGEPVDLLVNQKIVARGEVVVVEESFGLRITQLISPEERIKHLG
jgi:flagellar motor switch protein FliN